MPKKTFVIDTNILVTDPNSLYSFEDSEIILPFTIIEELDKLKSRPNEVGSNARETARILSDLINFENPGELSRGVSIGKGNILRVIAVSDFDLKDNLSKDWDPTNKDNHIIDICRGLTAQYKEEGKELPILLTQDIILRVKCDVLGIPSVYYKNDLSIKKAENKDYLFTGITTIDVPSNIIQAYWEAFGTQNKDFGFNVKDYYNGSLYPNQFIILNDPSSNDSPILRYIGDDDVPMKIIKERKAPICNITPRNREQNLALDLLMDDNIKLVTLTGRAGVGKSLIALAAGLEQVLEKKRYKTLLVCRPVVPVGNDLGFLPGSKQEKLDPWIAPIRDNLRNLLFSNGGGKKSKSNEMTLQMLQDEGIIEIEAITYLRGRSISNAFVLIDESQNLSSHELKTIITRVGENTKIVLTGDLDQIDSIYLDSVNNGLAITLEKFKEYDISGHIDLVKGERSVLATLASKIL